MDIVIPYIKDVLKGEELRYALRSIERNLTGWRGVHIIYGDYFPDFLENAAQEPPGGDHPLGAFQYEDTPGRKEYSVYRKLLAACAIPWITDDFIYWNDDHFLLAPLDVKDLKPWHNGALSDEIQRPHHRRWREAAKNTLVLYPFCLNFDIHRPIIFNKKAFRAIFEFYQSEVCIKSIYRAAVGLGGYFVDDLNLDPFLKYGEIRAAIEGKLFASSKTGITHDYLEVLEEKFPDKSKFEI